MKVSIEQRPSRLTFAQLQNGELFSGTGRMYERGLYIKIGGRGYTIQGIDGTDIKRGQDGGFTDDFWVHRAAELSVVLE